ncbi:gamma-glutamyltransferase [Fictibacillus sp. 7GRE50]|uniref:gamma-glutamyltransferase family protein n=1 Tax=unclassified Fictibacillus TaxID=2644029 RepID=UPI0018CDC6F7|nr:MULTISPECIES: gamma-glutamyltransferase [unclassified Fictibacillus]MBH0164171.1 gamma-glutamyltransferase [Fictibacillus sp. 7GRE50]MBH0173701.1 gamma-glutamyltransferase [Fictibacillus sp. 23RED33]
MKIRTKIFIAAIVFGVLLLWFNLSDLNNKREHTKKYESNKGFESSLNYEKTGSIGVSASHPIAVRAGIDILEQGGNAVDAAIAVSFVLNVVEPYGSGMGGGGGMLIQNDEKSDFINYRERAPSQFLTTNNKTAIPGFVKGMEAAHKKYGSLSWEELLEPAVDLAELGFKSDQVLSERLSNAKYRLDSSDLSSFFPDGQTIEANELVQQKELADTLKVIQSEGAEGFYSGEVGKELSNYLGISNKELNSYSVKFQKPVRSKVDGYEIVSAPPPFSGITFIQMLKLANKFEITDSEGMSEYIHLSGEIQKATYHSRSNHLSDPYFNEVNEKYLLSASYMNKLSENINRDKISEKMEFDDEEHTSTTHFVIMDKKGTIVSATNTLSNFFGTGKVIKGFFLNNQMDNFSAQELSANYYSQGKQSRSYTTPSIIKNKELTIGIGSPGGSRIPMALFLALNEFKSKDVTLQDAVDHSRFYFDEDKIFAESSFPNSTEKRLKKLGYSIDYDQNNTFYGGIQALVIDKQHDKIYGVADKRRNGSWMVK